MQTEISMSKISVLLPCYNGSHFLFETLSSINRQTLPNFEVIFVNDGSTDNSLDIFKTFKWRKGIDVTIIDQKNKGFLVSLLRGMKRCNGDIVARCDADDVWHISHLQRGVQALVEDENLVLVGSRARLIDKEGSVTGMSLRVTNPRKYLLKDNPFIHSSVLFRREAYDILSHGYDSNILLKEHFADYILFVRLSAIGSISIFEDPSLDYRVLHNSMSRKYVNLDILVSRRYCIKVALESSRGMDKLYGFFWLFIISLRIYFENTLSFWRK